jgi:hypothetical protein
MTTRHEALTEVNRQLEEIERQENKKNFESMAGIPLFAVIDRHSAIECLFNDPRIENIVIEYDEHLEA